MVRPALFAACFLFACHPSFAWSQEGLLERDRNAIAAVEKAVADYLDHHAKVTDHYFVAIKSELLGSRAPLPSLTDFRFLMARDAKRSASYFACSSLRVDLAEPGEPPSWREVLRRDGALAVKSYKGEGSPQASRLGEYEKDDEKMPQRPSAYPEFDPLHVTVASLGEWAGNLLHKDAAKRKFDKGRLYQAKYAENGDLLGRWDFAHKTGGAVLEITFQKARNFLPVSTQWWRRRGKDRNGRIVTGELIDGTVATWAQTADGVWLPETVLVTQVNGDGKASKWSLEYAWDLDEATVARLPEKSAPDWRVAHFDVFEEFLDK